MSTDRSSELGPVPLSPADVDLTKDPARLLAELESIEHVMRASQVEWYVQSSLATHAWGVRERRVTDIDIRIDHDLRVLGPHVQSYQSAKIRPPVRYAGGEFRNECLVLEIGDTHVDITADIRTYNRSDDAEYSLPFDRRAVRMPPVPGMRPFPFCSIEYLILYKLIHRRGANERKSDIREVERLLGILATAPIYPLAYLDRQVPRQRP